MSRSPNRSRQRTRSRSRERRRSSTGHSVSSSRRHQPFGKNHPDWIPDRIFKKIRKTRSLKRQERAAEAAYAARLHIDRTNVALVEKPIEIPNRYSPARLYEEQHGVCDYFKQSHMEERLQFSPPPAPLIPNQFDRAAYNYSDFNQREMYSPPQPQTETSFTQNLPIWEQHYRNSSDMSHRPTEDIRDSIQTFTSAEEGHPDIPIFDGVNPDLSARQWLLILEDIANRENWTCDKKKCQMAIKLVGAAKEWFFKEDNFSGSWISLKKSFKQQYPSDMEFYTNLQRMVNRVKNDDETYGTYFTLKIMMLQNCGISGRKAVSCLIGGLSNTALRSKCYDKNFATPEHLYNYVFNIETCSKCNKVGHSTNNCFHNNKKCQKNINPNRMINIRINGFPFQAYDDPKCEHITITETEASNIKLSYSRFKRTITGVNGFKISALGDSVVLIKIDKVVLTMTIVVVPCNVQEFPVIIGDSFRKHSDVLYKEDSAGICYRPKSMFQSQSSFSMNEKIVERLEGVESGNNHQLGGEGNSRRQKQGFNPFDPPNRFNY